MYSQRLSEAKRLLEQLMASPKYHFSDLKPSHLVDGLPVVYAIFDEKAGKTLYVGRTKNLRRRLYTNHLMGPRANARLKKYLTDDPAMPEIETMEQAKQYLKDRCYFQYIEEGDMRRRGQVEGLLGYLLDVRYIHGRGHTRRVDSVFSLNLLWSLRYTAGTFHFSVAICHDNRLKVPP